MGGGEGQALRHSSGSWRGEREYIQMEERKWSG